MDQIAVDETQREYLDQLRERLADEHVGEYGHVRDRDALQYLIDHHEATEDIDTSAVDDDSEQSDDAESEQSDDAESEQSDDTESDETDAEQSEEEDTGDETSGSASRLERMMGLLDDHEDVWEQSDSEEGRYAVTLPDGSTERVRTKDDVRALLFQHYD